MGFQFVMQLFSYLYVTSVRFLFTEERSSFFVCSRVADFLSVRQGGAFDFDFLLLSFGHLDVILALLSDPS